MEQWVPGETIVPGEKAARQLYPPGKDAGGLNQSGHREDGKQSDENSRNFFFFLEKVQGGFLQK